MTNRSVFLIGLGLFLTVSILFVSGITFGFRYGISEFLFYYEILSLIIGIVDFFTHTQSRTQALLTSLTATIIVFGISLPILYFDISATRQMSESLLVSIIGDRFAFCLLLGIASLGYPIGIRRVLDRSIYAEVIIAVLTLGFFHVFRVKILGIWSAFVPAGHVTMGIGAGIAAIPLAMIVQKGESANSVGGWL